MPNDRRKRPQTNSPERPAPEADDACDPTLDQRDPSKPQCPSGHPEEVAPPDSVSEALDDEADDSSDDDHAK